MVAGESYRTRRFTAKEVWRMLAAGVLTEDERVELIEGELVVLNAQGPIHATLVHEIQQLLAAAYGRHHFARTHSPVQGTVNTIPEPDIAVVTGRAKDYLERHPGPKDVVLLVEVSDSSRRVDRRKASVYAAVGYADYWIVDVINRRVEVRTSLKKKVYARTEIVDEGATVKLPRVTKTVAVSDLLP